MVKINDGLKNVGLSVLGTLIYTYIIQPLISFSGAVGQTAWQRITDYEYIVLSGFSIYGIIIKFFFVIILSQSLILYPPIKIKNQAINDLGNAIEILIPILLVFTMQDLSKLPKYERFQHNIVKITPYISQQEIDILKSDWTQMKGKTDYDSIQDRIKKATEDNRLN